MIKAGCLLLVCWLGAASLAIPGRAENLTVPGSGNPEFILGRLAETFNNRQDQHRITVPRSTGTAGALRDIASGAASLARVGRRLREAERAEGIELVPLGRDPVVFVAGAGVTATAITSAQAVAVFTKGVSDWQELGGAPAPIRAIGREVTDASRMAIARYIKAFESVSFGDNVKVVHIDFQLIELLDRFPTSLGFLNRSALFAAQTRIVVLALDGVAPVPENVSSGKYPVFVELGLIHKLGQLTPAGQAFVAFIQSSAGTRVLQEHGVLPAAPKTE